MTDHLNWNQLQIKCSQLRFQKGKSFLVSNFNRWRNLPRSSQQSNGLYNINIRIFAVVNCKIGSQRSAANPMYSEWWTRWKVYKKSIFNPIRQQKSLINISITAMSLDQFIWLVYSSAIFLLPFTILLRK